METLKDILITEGINAKGFGTISKLVMLDRRITIQAKAIYAYFCSYAGGGSQPFPSVEKILCDLIISEDTYYKHLLFLKAYGYVIVGQRKNGKGKFLSNIYTLTSHPVPNLILVNQVKNKNSGKKSGEKDSKTNTNPSPKNSGTDSPSPKFPCTDLPCTEKPGTNINNKSFNNNKSLIITTTESNLNLDKVQEELVVVSDTISNTCLKNEIDKTIGGNVNLKVINKLVNKQGIEKIRYCLYNWFSSVESFFVKAVKEGYKVLTPGQTSITSGCSNRFNFEQRDPGEDYDKDFFNNTKGNVYHRTYLERYIRDISKKIRANLRFKIEQGEYIGNAPYGYVKSINEKNRLVIDERIAPVVREIFSLYKKGYGYAAISNLLNEKGYPSPSSKNSDIPITPWNQVSVQRILCNRVYIGDTVQGVSEKISFKNKKTRRLPFDKWIITTNTHEPIVANTDFDEVQKLRARKRSNQGYNRSITHLLSNLIFCGNCGKVMYVRARRDKPVGYVCSSYSKNGCDTCTSHYVSEQTIIDVITKELLELLTNRELIDSFCLKYKRQDNQEQLRREVAQKLEQQIILKQKQQDTLYSDRLESKISEQLFSRMNQTIEARISSLNQEREKIREEEMKQIDKMHMIDNFINKIKSQGINKSIVALMVNKIVVYDSKDNVEALGTTLNEEELNNGLIVVEYNYNSWREA